MVFEHIARVLTREGQENLDRLQRAAENVKREFQEGDKVARRYGDAAGRVGSSAGKLAGVLDRVSPELGEVARLTADGADAFEVASVGGSTFLGVLGRIAAILGPVAVAAGVLAGAYYTLTQALNDANEAAKEAAKRGEVMADIHAKVREQALLAALATGELTQEEYNRIAAAKTAGEVFANQQQDAKARLRTSTEEIKSLQQQRAATEALIETLKNAKQRGEGVSTAGQGGILAGTELVTTTERLQQAQNVLGSLNAKIDEQALAARNAAVSMGVLTEAQGRYADDIVSVTDGQDLVTASIEDTTIAVLTLASALGAVDLATLGRVTGATGAVRVTSNTSEQIEQAMQKDAPRIALKREAVMGGVATGLNALANPAGALGLLGPAGAVLGGLNAVGSMGADGVEQRLDELKDGLVGGLEALPEIIGKVLPEFIAGLAVALPGAILKIIPELVRGFIEGWRNRRDDGSPGGTAAYSDNPDVQAELEARQSAAEDRTRDPFATTTARSSRGATVGRLARAHGAARLSIARSPTGRGLAAGTTIQVNQLGPADATQDSYLRTLANLQNSNTGLRG